MKTGIKTKKVDFQVLSDCTCKTCNRPLKQNSKDKGHVMCFYCFKLSIGKEFAMKKVGDKFIKIDYLKIQKQNIIKYGNN